jgi:hypothetical protein
LTATVLTPEERSAEIDEFMRFVREVWPERRARVLHQIASRCTSCGLSERCSTLRDGVCNECRTYAAPSADGGEMQMARNFDALLESYQGKAKGSYDALVMFSGGKDSALLLHRLRQQFPGLRLLALMVDNGFTSPVAFANARRVSSVISDVDYLSVKPKESLFRNMFRHALTHLNAGGCYSSVDRLCGDLTFDIGRNTAASFGIPLLLHGGTRAQVQRILKLYSYETPRNWEHEKRESTGGFVLREIHSAEELKYWWDGSAWPSERVPRVLFPYYAWPYDEEAIRRSVQQLGLLERGNENPIVSNYELLPVNFAVDNFHLRYSGYEPEFTQLIREKRAAKAQWVGVFESIEYLAGQGLLMPRCIADTLHKLGLTHEQVGLPSPGARLRIPA